MESNTDNFEQLFDDGEAWELHWRGMPEFVQEALDPYRTVYIHFACKAHIQEFARLIGQRLTADTRSVWFPEAEIGRYANKRYIDSQ